MFFSLFASFESLTLAWLLRGCCAGQAELLRRLGMAELAGAALLKMKS